MMLLETFSFLTSYIQDFLCLMSKNIIDILGKLFLSSQHLKSIDYKIPFLFSYLKTIKLMLFIDALRKLPLKSIEGKKTPLNKVFHTFNLDFANLVKGCYDSETQ